MIVIYKDFLVSNVTVFNVKITDFITLILYGYEFSLAFLNV